MVDYSFLRLEKSFEKAKNIGNPRVSTIRNNNQVHLIPEEYYCQITNTDFGITLAGDYVVKLVDCCDNEIADITSQFAVYEISDIRGLNQIAFEFRILEDYGFTTLHLKITHTESEFVYYSSPFVCTETLSEQTSLFVYRNYGYFNGISYDKFDGYQAIRLKMWFNYPENQTETSEYYQITTKNTISSRALYKQIENYMCEYMNPFVYERANIMLIHDVVFVDEVRITNKPQLSSEERIGNTNYFVSNSGFFKDYNDTYKYKNQIFSLQIVNLTPTGYYINVSPAMGVMTFNVDVFDLGNTVIEMRDYFTDGLILSKNGSDLTITGNVISFSLSGLWGNGKYYFTVTPNSIESINGILFEGIQNKEVWNFRRKNGDYSGEDYDSVDYSIYQ